MKAGGSSRWGKGRESGVRSSVGGEDKGGEARRGDNEGRSDSLQWIPGGQGPGRGPICHLKCPAASAHLSSSQKLFRGPGSTVL